MFAGRARAAGKPGSRLPLTIGPAFVAAIAYVDPGNFATNFSAGAGHGFLLVWVVVAANLAAMPVQFLSAKLGLATDRTLPQLCRDRLPRWASLGLWGQAEIVAMATELAELIGAALALNLLFGVPLLPAGFLGAAISFAVLALTSRGLRPFDTAIAALLMAIVLGFGYQAIRAGLNPVDVASGLVPRLAGQQSLLLAVGIIGATVMPHAVYVHSALTVGRGRGRSAAELLRETRFDVIVALGIAGVVNLTMLAVAATVFRNLGSTSDEVSLEEVHAGLGVALGSGTALAFGLALLASGISSSSVGGYAGQVIMNGFTGWRISLWLRRLITMAPALLVLGLGIDPTMALVVSQVVLSFGIPFALMPLLWLSSSRAVMGDMVNRTATTVIVALITAVIIALNATLLWQQFFG